MANAVASIQMLDPAGKHPIDSTPDEAEHPALSPGSGVCILVRCREKCSLRAVNIEHFYSSAL